MSDITGYKANISLNTSLYISDYIGPHIFLVRENFNAFYEERRINTAARRETSFFLFVLS